VHVGPGAERPPRALEHLSNALAASDAAQLALPLTAAMIQGAIGPAYAPEFLGFLQLWRTLPDPDAVLAAPSTPPLPDMRAPDGPSTTYALAGALAYRVGPANLRAWDIVTRRFQDELTVVAWELLIGRLHGTPDFDRVERSKEHTKFCLDYQQYYRP